MTSHTTTAPVPTTFLIDAVYTILKKEYSLHHMPVVELISIQTNDPFKILLSTILSTRTKDQTTAAASIKLFSKVNTLSDLEKLSVKEIENLIYPVGFYHNKAQFLKQLPDFLTTHFNGTIPQTVEELITLPGVGRKVANLVVALGFNKPALCVDVHVHRILNRLGYIQTKGPFETEMTLREILPKKYWITINSYLVSFGQNLCAPVRPRCESCPIEKYCAKIGVKKR